MKNFIERKITEFAIWWLKKEACFGEVMIEIKDDTFTKVITVTKENIKEVHEKYEKRLKVGDVLNIPMRKYLTLEDYKENG